MFRLLACYSRSVSFRQNLTIHIHVCHAIPDQTSAEDLAKYSRPCNGSGASIVAQASILKLVDFFFDATLRERFGNWSPGS